MKILFVIIPSLLVFFVAGTTTTLNAQTELRWRKASDNAIKLQIQNWPQEVAPKVSLKPFLQDKDVKATDKASKPFLLPAFEEMAVKGNWQLNNWMPDSELVGLAEGLYRFSVEGEERDDGELQLPDQFQAVRAELLHQTGEVSWSQPTPGAVRVLLQFPSGLTLGTISDWQVYGPGEHTITYDFKGLDGIDYRYQPNLIATVQVASLPNDFFVVGNPVLKHANLPSYSYDLQMNLKQPEGTDHQVLRVELTPDTLKEIGTRRFEVLIYVDGVFVHEESQGVSPYSYILPDGITKGAKLLTVNLLDYEGNWGVHTIDLSK